MTNLPPRLCVYPAGGGRLVAGWLQLVATEIFACLSRKLRLVAGMAAFFKTFSKERSILEEKKGEKAYRNNNGNNLPYLPPLPLGGAHERSKSPPHHL